MTLRSHRIEIEIAVLFAISLAVVVFAVPSVMGLVFRLIEGVLVEPTVLSEVYIAVVYAAPLTKATVALVMAAVLWIVGALIGRNRAARNARS